MQTLITTILLVLGAAAYAAAQEPWQIQNPFPHANEINAIHTFDSLHAFASGNFTKIMETKDGGNTWIYHDVETLVPQYFVSKDVYFTDAAHGFMAGSGMTVLRTNDGGNTWQNNQISSTNNLDQLNRLYFRNAKNGWAIGYRYTENIVVNDATTGGIIFHTNNGGDSWQEIKPFDSIPPLFDIHFLDSLHGWAAGNVGFLIKTDDGGATWKKTTILALEGLPSTFTRIYSVAPLSTSKVAISTIQGSIFITDDAGATWTKTGSNIGRKLKFQDSLRGIAYGSGPDYYQTTQDGGVTWTKVSFPAESITSGLGDGSIETLSAPQDGSLWIAGGSGVIRRSVNRGESWERITSATENMSGIFFADKNNGWAFGSGNTFLRTTNGGASWSSLRPKDKNISLQNMYFANAQAGWLVEVTKPLLSLLQTNDGGTTWNKIYSDSIATLTNLRFFDTQNGIAVRQKKIGGVQTIITTSNGGKKWDSVYSMEEGIFSYQMNFTSRFNGWLVGSKGLLLHTADGGKTWKQSAIGASLGLYSIHFRDSLNGWIGGEKSSLFKTTDGGATWQNKTDTNFIKNSNILSIVFKDALHGALADQRLWETKDGGATWQPSVTTPVQNGASVTRVFALPNGGMWAAGNRGIILHRAASGTSVAQEFEKEKVSDIRVYPNPASGTIQISITDSKKGILTLTDALGKEVCTIAVEQSNNSFKAKFNTDNVPSGSYFLQWKSGDKQETIALVIAR
ncbi:MAG: YCF48-related protein [Bacteroidota bacterium]